MTSKSTLIIIVITTFVGAAAAMAGWFLLAEKTAVSQVSKQVKAEILKGSHVREVAETLRARGIIHSPLAFIIAVKLKGVTIKAGTFDLDPSQPLEKIVDELSSIRLSEIRITFPEGWRVEQIAERLFEAQLIDHVDQFIDQAKNHEGYLFPDTYQFSLPVGASVIVDRMRENFQSRTRGLSLTRDDVILASIIEREAKRDEDRPKMAGVFKNRLSKGMMLEADPTVQYALDTSVFTKLSEAQKTNYQFWGSITLDQAKTFESPYNTYRKDGLPPAPIANPGLKSLEATVHPTAHDYYYFFNVSDGTTIYSKTVDEHNANKKKYGLAG